MKTLFLDCGMGAAGDMVMGALLDLIDDKEAFIDKINSIGIPKVKVAMDSVNRSGIQGIHARVTVDGVEEHSIDVKHGHVHEHCHGEDHDHGEHVHTHAEEHSHGEHVHTHAEEHSHGEHVHTHAEEHNHGEHGHTHTHEHASLGSIVEIVDALDVSEKVKEDVKAIYAIISEAESLVHGKTVSEVHFHEVGMMDAVADITGCALLMEQLAPKQVIATPVNVGYGHVKCAHGILPVPAPATANILKGMKAYAGDVEGELCTPTGAAILKYYVDEYANMPGMEIERVGYGMGTKEFEVLSCVRTLYGETF